MSSVLLSVKKNATGTETPTGVLATMIHTWLMNLMARTQSNVPSQYQVGLDFIRASCAGDTNPMMSSLFWSCTVFRMSQLSPET